MSKSSLQARPLALGLIYFALAAATIATTRFGGGVAFIWVANAFLVAALKLSPRQQWPATLAACGIASFAATALVGTGLAAALPLAIVNLAESIVGVLVLQWLNPRSRPLETLAGTFLFIFSLGVVAPAVTAPAGAAVVAAFTDAGFVSNAIRWYAGHALGALTFTPLFIFILSGDARSWLRSATVAGATEAAVILVGMAATSIVVFSQNDMPLLFLPALPLMVALFRIGTLGGACSILILTGVGCYFTMQGQGPASLVGASSGDALQFFQFYLAIIVFIALPVAAELAERSALLSRVRDSETRFRMLADHSSDAILSLDADGVIRFASGAVGSLGGYQPDEMVGRKAAEFVPLKDLPAVLDAHRAAFEAPGLMQSVEHRSVAADGSHVWVEAHVRALVDGGMPVGLVTVLREISHRIGREQELVRQAQTDSLTGLLNRRGFFSGLDAFLRSSDQPRSCFALFDLDHFKLVNDRHGHPAGDEVLEEFARLTRSVVRDHDLVGRIGGEEFGVLLKGASWEQAMSVCDRLRIRCSERPLRIPSGEVIQVTVSAGVVEVTPGKTSAQIYRAADEALYRAKAQGRNQIAA